jgi:hypothetical protein
MAQRASLKLKSYTPAQWFLRSAFGCATLAITLFALGFHKIERYPISQQPIEFNAERAHRDMTTLSKTFPNRTPWSDSRKKAAIWLKQQFRAMGYEPQGQTFSEVIEGKLYTDLENVYAIKRGTKYPDEIIAVAAHYDITDTTVEGAMDDASGIGVILELARIFADEPTERSLLFLATDSEEFGAFWGAREFARLHPESQKIVAVANFDFVASGKQKSILMLCDGLRRGYTPLWIREIALDSLRSIGGFDVIDFTNGMEFIERALLIPPSDHGAFLEAGIPAFNWVGQNENFSAQMAHIHHTHADVAEAMEVDSFRQYGSAAERFVRSLDLVAKLPPQPKDGNYWKITKDRWLDGPTVFVIHLLFFIPFVVYSIARSVETTARYTRAEIISGLKNEAKNVAVWVGALFAGYLLLQFLPELKIITKYEAFPATQKSEILYRPDLLVMVAVIAVTILIAWGLGKVFADETEDEAGQLEIRHAFHGLLLTLVIFLAFLQNSYLAVLLLVPPAYSWMALRTQRTRNARLLNLALLFGGVITFLIMTVVMSSIFHIGFVPWYLFLGTSYGLISAYTVTLAFAVIAMGIRLFRKFVLE